MRSLSHRVERLEQRAGLKTSELDQRLQAQFEADAAERGSAWVRAVEEVGERFRRAHEAAEAADRDPVTDRAVHLACEEFMAVRYDNRPPWPPEVRKIYEEDPEAQPMHDCADCGLDIPCRPGRRSYGPSGRAKVIEPFHRYFDSCPACGGHVGYEARFLKQSKGE